MTVTKTWLIINEKLFKPLAESVLMPLGLTATVSATDTAFVFFLKKNHGYGTTAFIISNEEVEDIMKQVKSLKEFGLIRKHISGQRCYLNW